MVAQLLHPAGGRDRLQRDAELGLSAGALEVHHQLPGHAQGGALPVVLGDQRQRQVEARGDAGAGPHIALTDEDRVGIHRDGRVVGGELRRGGPVGGGALAVEESGGGEQVRAHAHGRDPGRARRQGARPRHDVGRGGRAEATGGVGLDGARHDERVDPAVQQLLEGHVRQHPYSGGGGDRFQRLGGEHHPVGGGLGYLPAQQGEHLRRPGDVQQVDAGEQHDGDQVSAVLHELPPDDCGLGGRVDVRFCKPDVIAVNVLLIVA